MKALDLFVEKQAGDRQCDFSSSRSLSREINGLPLRDYIEQNKTLSVRDKMSIASASLALGSPFFLFSLGATFAMVDEYDRLKEDDLLNGGQGRRRHPLKAAQELSALLDGETKIFCETITPLSIMTGSLELSERRAGKKKPKFGQRKDQSVFSSDELRVDNGKFLVEDRSWLKANKVMKKKFFLEDELERVNGKAEFSLVAGIIAQIERLDKELKGLGC
jgi:hypothetical protein